MHESWLPSVNSEAGQQLSQASQAARDKKGNLPQTLCKAASLHEVQHTIGYLLLLSGSSSSRTTVQGGQGVSIPGAVDAC